MAGSIRLCCADIIKVKNIGYINNKKRTILKIINLENGVCQLADRCGFAHGDHELRSDGEVNLK
jgi:hypothetical protein